MLRSSARKLTALQRALQKRSKPARNKFGTTVSIVNSSVHKVGMNMEALSISMVQPVQVVYSEHLAQSIVSICERETYQRVLLVTDSFVHTLTPVQETIAELERQGRAVAVFDQVTPDPLIETVDEGAVCYHQHQADCILAIGGGSVLDVARGIAIVATHGGSIAEYVERGAGASAPARRATKRCEGLISVPTTSGTGSELSNALIVTDQQGNKLAVLADNATSTYAVLDPMLTIGLPQRMTIASGLDAFCHAAEGYLSTLSNPITDAIDEKIMFLLYNYLPRAVANGEDLEARRRVMIAASLAGWSLNQAGTIVGHSIAHVLGAQYHIVHGEAVGYALPAVVDFVADVREHKVREIGKILGAQIPDEAPLSQVRAIVVRTLTEFRDTMLGLHPFEDYGISRQELVTHAQAVVDERFAGNTPKPLDLESATWLLEHFGTRIA